jgi:gliding motility-associated-like protein
MMSQPTIQPIRSTSGRHRTAAGRLALLFSLATLLPSTSRAQSPSDTINYTSTCVSSTILFASPLLDTFFAPDYIKWHFGDPASGYNDSSTAKKPRHVFATPGTYNVSLTVGYTGRPFVTLNTTINVITPLNYNFGPDVYLCQGQTTTLTAPAIPGAVYTWNDDSLTHTPTLPVSKSGVYTVSINGCGVTDSIGVFFSDTPKIDLGKDHIMCDSSNLLLNAAAQNGQYTWLLDGNTLPFTGDQLLTHYPGGQYVAVITVPGCGVYRDTVSITYAAPQAPYFDLGPDTLLCPKQVFFLNAHAYLTGATAYDWSTGARDSAISITNPGNYWVFVTYNGQCQVTDSVLVTYRGDKPLDFHDTAICQGSTLTLNADFGTGTYNWQSVPPQRDDQNQTGQSTYFVYRPGTYAIMATVGQCIYKDTLTVRFDDSLKVTLTGDTTICNGEDFWLQVKGNGDTYAWQDSSYSSSFKVPQSGIYTVVAQNGCGKDTLRATVNFTACGCQLLLPNAFTPDGDGRNDTFRPLHACEMTEFQLAIYDRFGDMVYRSTDPDRGWDGTFRGARVPPGNFVWMVHYFNTATKQPIFRKGTVMVIR